jgi:hypothetical protein
MGLAMRRFLPRQALENAVLWQVAIGSNHFSSRFLGILWHTWHCKRVIGLQIWAGSSGDIYLWNL